MTGNSDQGRLRIGLDIGGSKIEGILLSPEATELARYRVATPRDDYGATIAAIVDLTSRLTRGSRPRPQSASPSLVPSHPTLG